MSEKITENEYTSSSSDDESSESCSPVKELENPSERTECSLLVDLCSPPTPSLTQTQGSSASLSSGDSPLIDFTSNPVLETKQFLSQGNPDGLHATKIKDFSLPISVNNANSRGEYKILINSYMIANR